MKAINKFIVSLVLFSTQSDAIIIRHDKPSEDYQVQQDAQPCVVNLDFLMGTLIAPQWIITAAHGTPLMPAGHKVTIGGEVYEVDKIIPHPDYQPQGKSPELAQNNDLALLKLNKPVLNVTSVPLYLKDDETDKTVNLVGQGYIGNGQQGITGAANGLYRAQNKIDQADDHWLYFDFDAPEQGAMPLEGVSGPGDSGGPAFIQANYGPQLAGISSHQIDNAQGQPMVYGVTEKYTRVSRYIDWIGNVMKMSEAELTKVQAYRPSHTVVVASQADKKELLGHYQVAHFPTLIIEHCELTLCYRWEGQPRLTQILKSADDKWFTPRLNRWFEIKRNNDGKIDELYFHGYQGGRSAKKI